MGTDIRIERKAIDSNRVVLTNKKLFIFSFKCPNCSELTEEVSVKVETQYVYWLYHTFSYCPHCYLYFITDSSMRELLSKANKRFPKAPSPFFVPSNIVIIQSNIYEQLFIPKDMIDKTLYNRKNLPYRNSGYYEPSDEEFEYILAQYPDPAPAHRIRALKPESILSKEGYNYKLSIENRYKVLRVCVEKYGDYEVIKALTFNISMREHQVKGRKRFAPSIAVWKSDIEFVEKIAKTHIND